MLSNIKIIMVQTTLPTNIGSALRAMKTMGLSKLVLVSPKYFPHPDIEAVSAGASDLIESIEVVRCLENAIADCHFVFATSARTRHIPWTLLNARQAGQFAIESIQHQCQVAFIFGREDRGLTNEELALATHHVSIPVNDAYGVLNVAQAIQIICYELRMNMLQPASKPIAQTEYWDKPLATQQQMQQFYPHLEQMLCDIDFLDPNNPRLLPLRLRRLFGRMQLDKIEYHLLRGVFSRVQALSRGQWKKSSHENA